MLHLGQSVWNEILVASVAHHGILPILESRPGSEVHRSSRWCGSRVRPGGAISSQFKKATCRHTRDKLATSLILPVAYSGAIGSSVITTGVSISARNRRG